MRDCEYCGQRGTHANPVFAYFRVPRYFHTTCFERYADEQLAGA